MASEEVLSEVQESYASCEIRAAAFKIQDIWYNLLTCVRLSKLEPGEQQATLQRKWSELISPNNDFFQFAFAVMDWKNRDALFSMFSAGVLNLGTVQVRLGSSADLLGFQGRIIPQQSGDWSSPFPSFEAAQGTPAGQMDASVLNQLRFVESSERLSRHLSARTYASIHEAMQQFIGLKRDARPEYDSRIFLSLPIFARIEGAELTDGRLRVSYDVHPKLAPHLFVHGKMLDAQYHEINKLILLPSPSYANATGSILVSTVGVPAMSDDDCIDVMLAHHNLGQISLSRFHKRDLVPPEVFDPFWNLLQRFCPATEIRSLLTKPASVKDDAKLGKSQRQFELHISWLLSAFGFRAAWLGRHEKLRADGAFVELASLDVLAFNDARRGLILASCTMSAPNESDYNNLVNLRSHLLSGTHKTPTFTTHLVIFTAAAESQKTRQLDEYGYDRIDILDAASLRDAVEALEGMEHNWLFERLNRMIWEL